MDLVLEAEEKGGLFLPAIHSILARAIQRDPTTLSSLKNGESGGAIATSLGRTDN